jgi:hypothetical protein
MKLTQAALSAVLLVAPACATQRSQTREPASTAQAKPDAPANKTAEEKKKKAKGDEKLICEWVEPDIGSRLPQKVCHPANELQSGRSLEPQAPAGGRVPGPPAIQVNGMMAMNGPG